MKKSILFILLIIFIFSAKPLISDDDYLVQQIKISYEPISIYDPVTGKYLGCINCSKFDPNSIYNTFGRYGSEYSADSIWNKFGLYGSPYSLNSPWNPFTTTPPIIKDSSKTNIGFLTTNSFLFLPTLNPKRLKKKGFENTLIFEFKDPLEDDDLFDDAPYDW